MGKVYIQTVLDRFSRFVWAWLCTSKMPVTAVQILNNHVLPFFEAHATKVQTILSDNGRKYCGQPDKHPYEFFLQLEEIEHRTTKAGRPQSNGFIEEPPPSQVIPKLADASPMPAESVVSQGFPACSPRKRHPIVMMW